MGEQASTSGEIGAGTSLPAGTLILDGRFRIEALLGGGGMGLVYRAVQVSLGRTVAVKVLRDDVPLAQVSERFRREALMLSQVEHPSVVRIIDFGPLGESMCLVMEYVEGDTLESLLLREAPLSVERVERLFTQLAQGLAAIHARGIVHRDLKPDNVLVTRDGAGHEQARVLDFGIARLVETEGDAAVTQGGLVLGTPAYLSPEQALGQAADARSDLYAWGIMAFRALSGRHPFDGPSPREFIAQHVSTKPPSLRDLAPHLSAFPSLVAAVEACLAKDPAQRPQSAPELLELMTRVPVPLTLEVPAMPVEPPKAKGHALAVAVALGVMALALVAALVGFRNEPTRLARRLVESGRGAEALQVIDDAPEAAKKWPMQQLLAAALHQVGRHEEEWKVAAQVPPQEPVEAAEVEALADDFGHAETPKVRKLLANWPKATALPVLQALARDEPRSAQWGALRFIDLEYAGQGLALSELYQRALTSRDCTARRQAAKRLAELRTTEAMPALRALKESPRSRAEDCGQDAAAQALLRLEKE